MNTVDEDRLGVGPVLQATPFAEAVVAAIREENDDVLVCDEGAYLRVVVPGVCRLSRSAVQAMTGQDVQFPGDLEVIMSSFTGRIRLTDHDAVWWLVGETPPATSEEDRS
jgi:toluene monooxygenase system protein D